MYFSILFIFKNSKIIIQQNPIEIYKFRRNATSFFSFNITNVHHPPPRSRLRKKKFMYEIYFQKVCTPATFDILMKEYTESKRKFQCKEAASLSSFC